LANIFANSYGHPVQFANVSFYCNVGLVEFGESQQRRMEGEIGEQKVQEYAKNSPIISTKKDYAQGCQMVCFQTKNPNLGKFWRVSQWKMMVYFMDTWSILRSFVIFCGHLVQFVVSLFPFWYFVTRKIWQP
jgi:hypothetical protein